MPSPIGHKPYPGCEKGGKFGYLGWPDGCYNNEEMEQLGIDLIDWINKPNNIWIKGFFAQHGILWGTVLKLKARNEKLAECMELAKSIQEQKLTTEPYYKTADGNHARFMLARHHKGEWEDKVLESEKGDVVKEYADDLKHHVNNL